MSYILAFWHSSELSGIPKKGFIESTQIAIGHKALLDVDRQNGDDDDGHFERRYVVSSIRKVNDALHVEFENLATDEPIIISASAYVKGEPAKKKGKGNARKAKS